MQHFQETRWFLFGEGRQQLQHLQRAADPLTSACDPGQTSTVWMHHALLLFLLPPDLQMSTPEKQQRLRLWFHSTVGKNATSASLRNSFSLSGPRGNSSAEEFSGYVQKGSGFLEIIRSL